MLLYDSNAPGPNPVVVRQFILERGGLELDVTHVDLAGLANRGDDYRNTVNSRGEVPALRLEDGTVITEISAICALLDEVAAGGTSLFGASPQDRAVTNMWTRRAYLEICSPAVTWFRGTDMARDFYQGHRLHAGEAKGWMKSQTERGLERFDSDLAGRTFLCGDRFSMADIMLYAFLVTLDPVTPWLVRPDLTNLTRWRETMAARPSSTAMLNPLPERIDRA